MGRYIGARNDLVAQAYTPIIRACNSLFLPPTAVSSRARGRKRTTVAMSVLAGAFTLLYYNVSDLWISTAMAYVASLFTGFRSSANTNLTLEQVPEYRGTMMSINSASWYIGTALGAWLGGLMLLWYDYSALGIALGGAGVAASLLFQFLSRDPTV